MTVSAENNRLALSGPVVIQTLKSLQTEGLARIAAGDLVVDMKDVTEADSTAVSLLMELRRAAATHSRKLSVVNMPDNVRSLARLYGVTELLPAEA
ncbi:MAG: STAS domain-containing protein [Burkholderiales bacterium]